MIPVLQPTEVGAAASEAVRQIVARELAGAPIASYIEEDPVPWSVLADGGWDTIGIPEDGGATLLDLVMMARAWGEACIPLPLVVSTMAKRWSPAARATSDPVTVAVGRAGTMADAGRAPFGGEPAVQVARALGDHGGAGDDLVTLAAPPVDDFAPSLRLAEAGWVSTLAREPRLEFGVVWAAEATGCAERALALSVEYAKGREQFGRPIGSFQAVKHRLADMRMQTEAIETAVLWAAAEPDQASSAALYALDTAALVVESAIQVHGGMGFTWEVGLHFHLRHIVMLRELVYGLWT